MKKKKKIILTTIVIGTLLTASLVPVFLLRKGSDDNQETDQKTVDNYVEKLKKLTPKEVTIKETSGSVTKNKNAILSAIKNLDNFPSIPSGVTLEVKDDSKNLTLQGIAITLVVKKLTISKEVTGFKAKKSKTKVELDTDSVNNVKKILDDKGQKLVTIESAQAKVEDVGVSEKIVAKLQETIGASNLEGVTISVKADTTNANIPNAEPGIGFIITLSKGTVQSSDITDWKVTRTKTTVELDTASVNNVKKILDDEGQKLVTIESAQAKVEDVGVSEKIVAKLQETIGASNLEGVTISVKADTTNANIPNAEPGIGFIITLSKGTVQSSDITDWKVTRTKTTVELDTASVNNVKKILDDKGQKLVTIESAQAKVEDVGVSEKIVAKLQETIGASNLEGVTISVKADTTNANIPNAEPGIGFIITLSKGTVQSSDITDWKVTRTKTTVELDTASVNRVKKILDDEGQKLVTIESAQAKVEDVGVSEKIVAKLQETIGASNLEGVTISVKADTTNANIPNAEPGIGFIIILSKGTIQSSDIIDWKVTRTKTTVELDTASINRVKKILDDEGQKLVTIESAQAKVEDVGVSEKIVAKLQETIGASNLEGVTISVKADTTNANIPNAEPGIGFIIILSKGTIQSSDIIDWKVTRTKTTVELDTTSINSVKKILDDEGQKLVTIESAQAKVEASGVAAKIVEEIEKAIGPSNLAGVTIEVKADAIDGDIVETGLGTGFIITLSKGSAQEVEISNWKVLRTKTTIELDTASINSVKKILDDEGQKVVTIQNEEAKVGASGVAAKIVEELEKAIGPSNLAGVTIEVKADATDGDIVETGLGTGFKITLSKGTVQSSDITDWKVLRTKTQFELNTASINSVKKILDDEGQKVVTIQNEEAKVEASGVAAKIVEELEKAIGPSNLAGVTIEVKADATDGDIVETGLGTGFIITLSKGTAQEVEISNWKVLRIKTQFELDTASINSVKKILDDEGQKVVTIQNEEAKVGASGVAAKIVEELKVIIEDNLDGATIEVKADDNNENIVDTGNGIGFIIMLSKGTASVEISDWKVLRTKTQFELDNERVVDEFILKLNALGEKELTIFEVSSGTVNDHKDLIRSAIVNLNNFPTDLPDGLSLEVKGETTTLTAAGVDITLVVSKGLVNKEVLGFRVKLKLTGRNGVENSIRNYYVSFGGFKMEISNRVSLNDNNEIQTAIKNDIFYNVGTNKNWISIPNDVDSISLDETNPTKVIVTFSVGSINIKREFKVWKASS